MLCIFPRPSPENLADVPFGEDCLRVVGGSLGRFDKIPVVTHEPFLKTGVSMGILGDQEPSVPVQGECAPVEEAVVKGAEGKAVAFLVRPSRLVPLDVGRFQSHGSVAKPDTVPAHRAAVFVRFQYFFPEPGVSRSSFRG